MSEGQAPAPQGGQGGTSNGAAANAPAPADWTAGFNDELKGYVQTKGFKDPASVVDSYRNFEKAMGVPKERLLRLPEKQDDPEWANVWDRLGRPKEAKEYQIEVPKEGGDPKFAEWAREQFHKLNIPRQQAEALAKGWNEYQMAKMNEMQQGYQAKMEQEDNSLKKEWGMAYNQNIEVGKKAARELGFDGDTIDKLEAAMGYSGVMKLMHNLGSKLGEDSFVGGNANNGSFGNGKVLSPEQARFRINELRKDTDFVRRYTANETGPREEMERLHKMAYPDS